MQIRGARGGRVFVRQAPCGAVNVFVSSLARFDYGIFKFPSGSSWRGDNGGSAVTAKIFSHHISASLSVILLISIGDIWGKTGFPSRCMVSMMSSLHLQYANTRQTQTAVYAGDYDPAVV